MSSPVTNCSPIIRIARSTPLRISGSPPMPTSLPIADERPDSLCVATSFPVMSKPHVAAFTNSEGLLPRCDCHWPCAILSRISLSRVSVSGMRSSASARHMSATPSCEDNAYSCSRFCTIPARPDKALRSRKTRVRRCASAVASRAVSGGRRASSSRPCTAWGSGIRVAAVMDCRSGDAASSDGCTNWSKARAWGRVAVRFMKVRYDVTCSIIRNPSRTLLRKSMHPPQNTRHATGPCAGDVLSRALIRASAMAC